jgi:hypothetical protein
MPVLQPFSSSVQRFYRRHERYIPLGSFVLGFAYDSFTLQRIDRIADNLQMLAYLLLSGSALAVLGMVEYGRIKRSFILQRLPWVTILFHFCLGGLLSAYAIFYFKSAAFSKAYVFVGLLVVIWVLNEFAPRRIAKLRMLSILHFFCSCAFFTFFLPVLTHRIGLSVFIAGGLISLCLTGVIWSAVLKKSVFHPRSHGRDFLAPPITAFLILVVLYVFNWIPPVPLSVKEIGIYRSVHRLKDGRYEVRYRQPAWYEFFKRDERVFEYTAGDTVYCFAAIFAPTAMRQRVIHDWQMRTPDGVWKSMSRIPYQIVGGRDGGWRGYTMKRQIKPGDWRVDVVNDNGQILGRISLSIVKAEVPPAAYRTDYR